MIWIFFHGTEDLGIGLTVVLKFDSRTFDSIAATGILIRGPYSISREICTRFCCALLCCGYAIVHNESTWNIYPYSSGLFCWHWGNVRLPQCQWSKPDGYGKISQCITTTKHSKAKTVCIFLGYIVQHDNHNIQTKEFEKLRDHHLWYFHISRIEVKGKITYVFSGKGLMVVIQYSINESKETD